VIMAPLFTTSELLTHLPATVVLQALYAQFRERGTRKVYTAVVRGRLNCKTTKTTTETAVCLSDALNHDVHNFS
jgi:23S rRNA-/tRNA-specific pseudouridylate synthase